METRTDGYTGAGGEMKHLKAFLWGLCIGISYLFLGVVMFITMPLWLTYAVGCDALDLEPPRWFTRLLS